MDILLIMEKFGVMKHQRGAVLPVTAPHLPDLVHLHEERFDRYVDVRPSGGKKGSSGHRNQVSNL